MNIFKSIIYFVLSVQEKLLMKRLNKTLKVENKSKTKKIFGNGVLLNLENLADNEKQKMEEDLELVLKNYDYNPNAILEYIKKQGTPVFYINNAKSLHAIGENEGFIYPQRGAKAVYLSLLTEKKSKFNTNEMFVLTKGEINKFYFIYNLYNWYAFKHNIAGIDAESQELLNKFLFSADDDDFSKLQLEDIYKLKDAVKQDKASIDFVLKLCKKYDGAKNALKKMQDGGANL